MNAKHLARLTSLRTAAQALMAHWPQYEGMFDDWMLCFVWRKIESKLGVSFEGGELTICSQVEDRPILGGETRSVFSFRNRAIIILGVEDVRVIPEEEEPDEIEYNERAFVKKWGPIKSYVQELLEG